MKFRWEIAAGLLAVTVFGVLFAVRVGLFEPKPEAVSLEEAARAAEGLEDSESWMNLFQDGRKIGNIQSRFVRTETGYQVSENVFMQLTAMGATQETYMTTLANLNPDMTLDNFVFSLGSGLVSFYAKGRMTQGGLEVETGRGDDKQTMTIPMDGPPIMESALTRIQAVLGLKKGQRAAFSVFFPASMNKQSATVEMLGEEPIAIMGEKVVAKKLSIHFMGQEQLAWISPSGEMLAQQGILGFRAEKTSQMRALDSDSIKESGDIIMASSIPVSQPIRGLDKLKSLTVRVAGADSFAQGLDGGRQHYAGGVLTVTRESLPEPGGGAPYPGDPAFLASDAFVQSDHPEIMALAREIVDEGAAPAEKAQRIVAWAYKSLKKKNVFSLPQALETLRSKTGDCNEHAVLVAALARAAGVPAQIEVGVYYLDGRFFYHAWNSFWVGEWVTGDAVFGQFPTDVAHLRFAHGGPEVQMSMMGLIGRLQLEILEQKQ